jgi:hypothetical protein
LAAGVPAPAAGPAATGPADQLRVGMQATPIRHRPEPQAQPQLVPQALPTRRPPEQPER